MDKYILGLIDRKRRQILIHSCIYYRLNENIIDDHTYDRWSRELVDLQNKYPVESELGIYYEYFKTFDGTTGFDLPIHIDWVVSKSRMLIDYHRRLRTR